ncbi:MAG: inositol monophosphatase [Hyphomonadaceae bacterium]
MDDLKFLSALAEAAAGEAGDALKRQRTHWSGIEAELGREVKIDADRRAEAIILDALKRASDLPILSEERGWAAEEGKEDFWAVDPLDGSVNYIQGYPHCAVSIALIKGGRPVIGVVDCFLLGERFTGIVGEGAWLNGAPIRVSSVADPAKGVLNTGIPARMALEEASRSRLLNRLMQWRKVRMIGSAASALAYVAAGRADAYCENGSMVWDVAAGLALVEAAGGAVRVDAEALDKPLDVAASNGIVPMPD